MGGTGGWYRWVVQVGGTGGWYEKLFIIYSNPVVLCETAIIIPNFDSIPLFVKGREGVGEVGSVRVRQLEYSCLQMSFKTLKTDLLYHNKH